MAILPSALLSILAALAHPPPPPPVPAVLREFDRVCPRPLWPGFEPCRTPLAIFDGRRTWLVRHPSPPAEFVPARERGDVRIFEGRHEKLRANTSVELAGSLTAT